MTTIYPGRFTTKTDHPFVVFLIGMSINNWWAVHKWLPVFQLMSPMIKELYQHPEKGFFGGTFAFTFSGPLTVQYWRSFEDLERFARSPQDPHFPAWKRFYQIAKDSSTVGVWHETYIIGPGQYEAVYVNMPRFGLGNAMNHVPVTAGQGSARERLEEKRSLHNLV